MAAARRSRSAQRPQQLTAPPTRRGKGRPPTNGPTVGREPLIAVACELLRRMPLREVTRTAVSRAAQVDPATVRYHFKDTLTLWIDATERLTEQFLVLADRELPDADATAPEQLRARIKALLKLHLQYPFLPRLIDELSRMPSPRAQQLTAALTARGLEAYTKIIAAGTAQGVFHSANPRLLFLSIVGLCQYFVTGAPIVKLALRETRRHAERESLYADYICDLMLRSLQPPAG